jgi:hypothetical protein
MTKITKNAFRVRSLLKRDCSIMASDKISGAVTSSPSVTRLRKGVLKSGTSLIFSASFISVSSMYAKIRLSGTQQYAPKPLFFSMRESIAFFIAGIG